MCEDEAGTRAEARPGSPLLTRRRLLASGAVAAGAAAIGAVAWPSPAHRVAEDGSRALSMAMHIHTSFSEQSGSMAAHLDQAQRHGVDVIWWTDHDYRMSGLGYRRVVHFSSLTDERPPVGEGTAWQWQRQLRGPLTPASTGGVVASPASPLDPVPLGSLRVTAQSTGRTTASVRFAADSTRAGWNYHGTLAGQSLHLEVFPTDIGPDGYLELVVDTSYHPARAGRPAGVYAVTYRFGGRQPAGARVATGLRGTVAVPVAAGRWNSVTVRPSEDIAALWPDMQARDFASFGISLGAVSTGAAAGGYFDYLRISRQTSGDVQLHVQRELQAAYGSRYPRVTQHQGLEVSLSSTHLNWFGGGVTLPAYTGVTDATYLDYLRYAVVPEIHRRGGLASYNHPFGAGSGPPLAQPAQQSLLRRVAAAMLSTRAVGADLLEVGYHLRAGVDVSHHIALWDVCSRNALFLTGNGTTDDHWATNWTGVSNDWVTWVWAAGSAEPELLSALRAGRAWSSSLSRYRGMLDLVVDDRCPMGSVSVSTAARRQLRVTATHLPPGSTVQVLQGVVDLAGTRDLRPGIRVVATYQAAEMVRGAAALSVDTTGSSFVRTVVHDRTNRIVGLSNPVWLLRDPPAVTIPTARRV